ncbi:unnamed protein product [Rotaria sordida]|uniref:Riboflavin transporter n=1 Tax=Rotaria sordida TaxID=392033 RepID=A0A818GBQ6_9BILA|nr:unnamed protein product [Rotaria sordida]
MPYGYQIFYFGTILSSWMLTLTSIFGIIKPVISKLRSPSQADKIKCNILILIICPTLYVLLGYLRLIIANYVRNYSSNGMFWYGVNVQLGALIGSIIIYHLIETFSLLYQTIPCEQIIC